MSGTMSQYSSEGDNTFSELLNLADFGSLFLVPKFKQDLPLLPHHPYVSLTRFGECAVTRMSGNKSTKDTTSDKGVKCRPARTP